MKVEHMNLASKADLTRVINDYAQKTTIKRMR